VLNPLPPKQLIAGHGAQIDYQMESFANCCNITRGQGRCLRARVHEIALSPQHLHAAGTGKVEHLHIAHLTLRLSGAPIWCIISGRARILRRLIWCHLLPYIRRAPDGARHPSLRLRQSVPESIRTTSPARTQEKKPESLNVYVALHVQHKYFGSFCPFFD
jgi:hypothetical protein